MLNYKLTEYIMSLYLALNTKPLFRLFVAEYCWDWHDIL